MQAFLLTLVSLVAYIVGLVLVVQVTRKLLFYSYDDARFMVFAVLDILGAFLVFGSIVLSLDVLHGNLGIRALDFILLVVVILITGRVAFSCFLNNRRGVQFVSRYGAGVFCLFLSLAALYEIIELFRRYP
jgi:hypothetical protein